MARPGGPVTIRQVALDAGVARSDGRCADLEVPGRVVPPHDLGRSRISSAGTAGATGRNADRRRGPETGRTTLDLPSDRLPPAADDTAGAGAAATRVLQDTEVPRDSVIAVTDPRAVGVLPEARRQGLRPGTDVAATGYDDSRPASVVDGDLTSVRQPVERSARGVADLLDSANGERGVVLPAELFSRGSAPVRLTEHDVN
ncbi:substrate-binding domain-containing protein [Saccharothrix isguenensis]